jgi:peptidyl-prolyl cis-trans isomerase B (cyclophilin B)
MTRWWPGMISLTLLTLTLTQAGVANPAGSAQEGAASAATAPATTQASPADEAFVPIRKDFRNLFESLRNQGGMSSADEPLVRALRDRAAAFSRQFPDDRRGLVVELQLSIWLRDEELIRDLYARIAGLSPDNQQIPVSYAEYLLERNRFAEVINVINAAKLDPAKAPTAYLALSDALFAEERFGEALAALNAIPQSVLDTDMFIKIKVDEKKQQRADVPVLWEAEKTTREQEAAADDLPQAVIATSRGSITVELFENQALNTVANFIDLAEQGFYNGTKFHRVLPGFMAQGGDPNSKDGATGVPGQGNPGYYILDEVSHPDHRKHFTGSLAMAKTAAPNTGGCQFYITVAPTPHLNGVHTVFGRVLDGLDVVRNLQQNDVIETIIITRKRDHQYAPSKLPLPGSAPPTPPASTQPGTMPHDAAATQAEGEAPPATQPG